MYVWRLKPLDVALKSENKTIKSDKITLYMLKIKNCHFRNKEYQNIKHTVRQT